MYSFEGNFRQRPQQSLGGASRKEEKNALIQRTQDERRKREEQRLRKQSALQIQSFYRGSKCREKQKILLREKYDIHSQATQKSKGTPDFLKITQLSRMLLFIYSEDQDSKRLNFLCQTYLKNSDIVSKEIVKNKNSVGLFQIQRLLWLCCRHLVYIAKKDDPIASALRMLEVYTSQSLYEKTSNNRDIAQKTVHEILGFLMKKDYYKCMRHLIDEKVPCSLEKSINPPTPIAGTLLELIKKPLYFVTHQKDPEFRDAVLRTMCQELFCASYSQQISSFLLPALAYGKDTFPFVEMLHALVPACQEDIQGQIDMYNQNAWSLNVEATPWLLCSVLMLSERQLAQLSKENFNLYLKVLHKLVPQLRSTRANYDDMEDSDTEEDMDYESGDGTGNFAEARLECLRLLDELEHVRGIVTSVSRETDVGTLTAVCTVCHALMANNNLMVHKTRLLYALAYNPMFMKQLWLACTKVSVKSVTQRDTPLLQLLSSGLMMQQSDIDRIVPLLSVFCKMFSHSLYTLDDGDFFSDSSADKRRMPFTLPAIMQMSSILKDAALGIIDLAHPDTKPTLREDYKKAFKSVGAWQNTYTAQELQSQRDTWAYLFKVITHLVKQLYSRDSRRNFCPQNHWLSSRVNIQADKPSQLYRAQNAAFVRRPFGELSALNQNRLLSEEEGQPLSTTEVRQLTILTELPFVTTFAERVKIFHKLAVQDKFEHQGDMRHLSGGPMISIMIRRNYLYEDSFDKLSLENEPNLKLKTQVHLVNFAGLDEAGIDGGGIFREFLSELLKTAFDPNRGFFKYTTDRELYPNPQANFVAENWMAHYFFLGRILGKAIYENMLVELPFADFFLSKILSRSRGNVDFNHLASMDPELFKNLLFLKNYNDDVLELGLDFTVVNNELGEAQVVELKPGGKDTQVTKDNVIEYIHLMADYRLNKQIRMHCAAFRQGLADVVNLEWLRMFNHSELQTLISGAEIPIDVEDLQQFTNYSGGYTSDHPVIQNFWKILATFSDQQKRQLLKFVTSCSRPPLLGFKELYPAFCIHYAGNEADRLPTASTCMNLLKLPEFKSEETMRTKLLYAIESGAGFELS